MREESADVMTLGQRLLEISKIDPVIKKWTDSVAKESKRTTERGTSGAVSTVG